MSARATMHAPRQRRFTVRRKLVLLISAVLGVLSLGAYLYFPYRVQQPLVEVFAGEAHSISLLVAQSVAPALAFEDRDAALEVLQGVREATGITYIVVESTDGREFAERGLDANTRRTFRQPFPQTADAAAKEAIYRVVSPVLRGTQVFGTVYVGLSLSPLQEQVASLRRTVAGAALGIFALSVAAAYLIGRVVTGPLHQMVEATHEIARGNWEARAVVRSRDEAGELAQAFNLMLDHLAEARGSLERLNRDLELRVGERTAQLEKEVGERTRSEQALRAANERFVLAAAAVDGVIYDWNVRSDTVDRSDGLARVFGYAGIHVEPGSKWWFQHVHADDRDRVERQIEETLRDGQEFVSEYRFRHHDGRYRNVLDRGRALRDENGLPIRMVGIIEDMSDLKRLEEQLQQSKKMDAIGRLAGGVAHDFNNLLTAILGHSELLLLDLAESDPNRGSVDEIHQAAQRAAALTRQLLAFSRKQVIAPRLLDLNSLVEELEKLLRRGLGEDIVLNVHLDPRAGTVRADSTQLELAILNLTSNARDAMPSGGKLSIQTGLLYPDDAFRERHPGAREALYTVLSVRDTGHGMDAATLARAFEPFFTTKGPGKGTGLGLSIVYGFVQQSEGFLDASSPPGEGVTVTMYLPHHSSEELPVVQQPSVELARGTETVLLLEDEPAVRNLVEGILRNNGYHVLSAGSAADGMQLSLEFKGPIHLVLTDVVMPEVGGPEFVAKIRPLRPEARILYISGYTDDTVLRHGVMASEAAFLGKPFRADALLRKVREVLEAS